MGPVTVSEATLRLAVRNVAKWGDTDVLPYPLENHWFHDAEDDVVVILKDIDLRFADWLSAYPVISERALTNVGYLGYRSVRQIDPIWNAYLLALVIEIAPELEAARPPVGSGKVFSYRFAPDPEKSTLFDPQVGWHTYQSNALLMVPHGGFVITTDIADFYPRVYHHRIENSLKKASANADAVRRIMALLKHLSYGGVSYGLPIGGNAARIIAEALLVRTDKLLADRQIRFSRFVDDYYLYGESEEEVRRGLVFLTDILLTHEGLSLSRSKTRMMSAAEFKHASPAADLSESTAEPEEIAKRFLKIRLKYDPYSPTADEDFAKLAEEIRKFDIVGMLARELRKTRIDDALTKQLVKSLRFLDPATKSAAVDSLVQSFSVLFPIFPTVAFVLRQILPELQQDAQERAFAALRHLVTSQSHIAQVPANLAYIVRLLAKDPSEEAGIVLVDVYGTSANIMVRRDAILAMAARRSDHWVSDRLRNFATLTVWERRALLPASYVLGDEGSHWRDGMKRQLNPVDVAFLKWVAGKNNGFIWDIPI